MVIFIDTSGWYALLDTDDSNHHRAGLAWSRWLEEDTRFASDCHFTEMGFTCFP